MRRRLTPARLGRELIMVVVALLFAFPVYVLVTISLKAPRDVARAPLAPPTTVHLDSYLTAWTEGELGQAMVNSLVVAVLSVGLLVLFGSAAAYVLARRLSRLSLGLYLLFLLGLMVPLQLSMIPLYELMQRANLLGTYTSLIIFHIGHQMPFTVFLYAGFIRALPREYEEAALVDSATPFQAYRKIVFPLLRPITGTVVILTGISVWNDFLVPLLYVGGSEQRTLPVAIFSFRGEFSTDWGVIFAGMVLAIAPILVVYFLLQKYIIRGFASGLRG